jgi:hypothetical protein
MADEAIISVVACSLLFGAPMVYFMVESVAKNWRKARVAEQQTILKREMIDRGFSAEEIVRVLEAGGTSDEPRKHARCGR